MKNLAISTLKNLAFVGDSFFDFISWDFQMRQIPSEAAKRSHVGKCKQRVNEKDNEFPIVPLEFKKSTQ